MVCTIHLLYRMLQISEMTVSIPQRVWFLFHFYLFPSRHLVSYIFEPLFLLWDMCVHVPRFQDVCVCLVHGTFSCS